MVNMKEIDGSNREYVIVRSIKGTSEVEGKYVKGDLLKSYYWDLWESEGNYEDLECFNVEDDGERCQSLRCKGMDCNDCIDTCKVVSCPSCSECVNVNCENWIDSGWIDLSLLNKED